MTRNSTASSDRPLSQIAKHLVYPDSIVRTGWPKVERTAAALGIHFDEWQRGIGRLLLGKRADGQYACGVGGAGLSICRQTGKTFTIRSIVVPLCLNTAGLTVLWTAHRTRTSGETFRGMQSMANMPALRKHVKSIRRANGQEQIEFTNGSRIMFGAREMGFGRGFAGVDIEIFDEAQILTEKAADDMVPATNTSQNALIIYMGTPPRPTDPGELFTSKRRMALSGKTNDMLWVEFGADDDADSDDHAQWRKANPSYPHRTPMAAMQRMRRSLGDDSFRREALGIWDIETDESVITAEDWARGNVDDEDMAGRISFGVDMPPDRSVVAIGVAVRHDDTDMFVGLQEYRTTREWGTQWAVEWLVDHWPKASAVVIDSQSPAMSMVADLQAAHVKVMVTNARDLAAATGRTLDMIHAGALKHFDSEQQPQLARAALGATLRPIGANGASAWNKKGSDIDISPLQAITLAVHGAFTSKRDPRRKQRMRRLT